MVKKRQTITLRIIKLCLKWNVLKKDYDVKIKFEVLKDE